MKQYKRISIVLPEDIIDKPIYNQTIFLKKGLFKFLISPKDISTNGKFFKLEMRIEDKGDGFSEKTIDVNENELFDIFEITYEDTIYLIKFSNSKYIDKESEDDKTLLNSLYFNPKLNILWTSFSNTHDVTCLLKKMIDSDSDIENDTLLYNKFLYFGYPSYEELMHIYNNNTPNILMEITATKLDIMNKLYKLFLLKIYNYDKLVKEIRYISNFEIEKYIIERGF